MKKIALEQTITDIIQEYPETEPLFLELGFHHVSDEGMRDTVGKTLTLAKGMELKAISREKIDKFFAAHGFEIIE
ncbi:MAG: DUF1858 domain-containing protein [Enterococcaceae bacterium]|jgi:hypothetical protein|nr:DUF1858 domain-containing protein [Enterococcaceae bacterium]MCI1919223.1 DUF1858 domain-containing protein [Enterococcaceae bacterium]